MTVWPGDDDVLRVTLLEPVPLLITKDVEVEDIERLEVRFNGGGLNLGLRSRELRTLSWRLPRYGHVWHARRHGRDRHKGEVTIDDGTHGKSSFQYHGPGVSCFRGELPNGSRLSCGAETARSTQQHPDYHHSTSPDATSLVLRPGLRLSKPMRDRKSTRLNSSHLVISYAVFCLKKKKITRNTRNMALPCICELWRPAEEHAVSR